MFKIEKYDGDRHLTDGRMVAVRSEALPNFQGREWVVVADEPTETNESMNAESKPLAYLSGPIAADRDGAPERFAHAVRLIEFVGEHRVINPLDVAPICLCDDPYNSDGPHQNCHKRGDIAAMMKCSVVIMLPGSVNSRGAVIEHDLAVKLGIPTVRFGDYIERRSTITKPLGSLADDFDLDF